MNLNIRSLIAAYRAGTLRPSDVIEYIYNHALEKPVWISVVPKEQALKRAREVESNLALPLCGIPFAVKDNIDVAGMPTTVACPEFAYTPTHDSTVVQRLQAAGAILIGKTNMDQFATGLVGTRTPYGACSSVFDDRYISGGSSSGSAVAVAKGLVSFSLGTDTAGSGRVPAAFNNLIGLKPTKGSISTAGVVPACRSVDCVSVFAADCDGAEAVWRAAKGFDSADPFSRYPGSEPAPWLASGSFRFGVPRPEQLEFFGDAEAAKLFGAAVAKMQAIGGEPVIFDLGSFRSAAELLYAGPWVAERYAAVGRHIDVAHPVVAEIIRGGLRYSAVDAFNALYKLNELKQQTQATWEAVDVLILPTTPTIYTIEQVNADPIRLNSNLGYYTNFVNLMDLVAIAVPAGFRPNGLPFGVSLIGQAFTDEALLELAKRYIDPTHKAATPGCVSVAVVGAHLTGQPLNRELTLRGARLLKTCRTAPGYRLYALQNTKPPKPGLVREPTYTGPGIEVEVWSIPEDNFGSFVAGVPAPLGIGTATLDDGSEVKCFICEPFAVAGSREITEFGGWRKYLSAGAK